MSRKEFNQFAMKYGGIIQFIAMTFMILLCVGIWFYGYNLATHPCRVCEDMGMECYSYRSINMIIAEQVINITSNTNETLKKLETKFN